MDGWVDGWMDGWGGWMWRVGGLGGWVDGVGGWVGSLVPRPSTPPVLIAYSMQDDLGILCT